MKNYDYNNDGMIAKDEVLHDIDSVDIASGVFDPEKWIDLTKVESISEYLRKIMSMMGR